MIKILHNNSCSKSRTALEYLDENDVKFEIIDFIENPLSKMEIQTVLKKLNCNPIKIIRFHDTEFQELNLNIDALSDEQIIDLLCEHPQLLQRPILIKGKIAMVGRPIENVKYFIGK